MKKTITFWIFVLTIYFTCLGQVFAQEKGVEVLAYILPDSLEIPAQEKGQVSLEKAIIKGDVFRKLLNSLEIRSIGKAFPDWDEKDGVVFDEEGIPIPVSKPNFQRVFSIRFDSEKQADYAITRLVTHPAVIYAERNMLATLDSDTGSTANEQAFIVCPNPNTGSFEVAFYLEKNKTATLSVWDLKGKSWFKRSLIGQGNHREDIILTGQTTGTYIVRLTDENESEAKKVIVVR